MTTRQSGRGFPRRAWLLLAGLHAAGLAGPPAECGASAAQPAPAAAWSPPAAGALRLAGAWGAAQAANADRLGAKPLDAPAFILDDVALQQHRKFAEYSGDISGRWIGAAAWLAPQFPRPFAALPGVLAAIPTYQKSDGHFGADQQLPVIVRQRDMPILWGNGRLLIGLVEVYEHHRNPEILAAAKRLGDYFVATDPIYDRPENLQRVGGDYADGFATCYFSCIEGLVALGRVTGDARYLEAGRRIAALAGSVDNFDHLHAHGRLCAERGLADLYAVTAAPQWRAAAERDWQRFMERYRLPTGGIKEVLDATCVRDEGCAVADWLRFNIELWRLTGAGQYLDEAERCLKGHFSYQQFANGGAGHRMLHQIDGQPVAFKALNEEAWWCCSEHWARALVDVARAAVTGDAHGLSINLAVDGDGDVAGPGGSWQVRLRERDAGLDIRLTSPAAVTAAVRIHRPAWAQTGATLEKPAAFSLTETPDAWVVTGTWSGAQELRVRLPVTLRSEAAPGGAGVLLCGHDLLAAHRTPANAWLMDHLPAARPAVLWAALEARDGRIHLPASLAADADPARPEQWRLLELAPLRHPPAQPHVAAWFSFALRAASPAQVTALVNRLRAQPPPAAAP